MTGSPRRSFAEKLSHLIATVHPPDRDRYSFREISAGIEAQYDITISSAYIHQLANGARENPKSHYVQALADYFGVPPAYFFDDETTARIDEQLDQLIEWRETESNRVSERRLADEQLDELRRFRNSDAGQMAERIEQLSQRDRDTVANLVDSLLQYQQQPRSQRQRRKR